MTFDLHVRNQVSLRGAVGVAHRAVLPSNLSPKVIHCLHLQVVVMATDRLLPVKLVDILWKEVRVQAPMVM